MYITLLCLENIFALLYANMNIYWFRRQGFLLGLLARIMKRAHQDTVCGLKLVCFRGDNGVIIQVWTSTDGKVDFKILANYFLLKLETITLNGTVFPLDSTGTGKSDASWMQIKNALRVEGTEEHPVRVGGNPGIFLDCVILFIRFSWCKL